MGRCRRALRLCQAGLFRGGGVGQGGDGTGFLLGAEEAEQVVEVAAVHDAYALRRGCRAQIVVASL